MRAVINNSRSEPEAGLKTAADAARDAVVTSVPDKRLVDGHIAASNKWMADLKKKEEDEFGDWPLSPDDELKVVDTVDKTALLPEKNPSTPQKATMQFDSMVTPGSKRKREEAWPTPQTSHRIDIFTSPRTNRLKGGMWDGNEKAGFMSPLTTPIPDRFHEAMKDAAKTGESSSDYDITQEVMALFKSQPLDDDTSAKLSQVLNQYALKSLGLARGRDMTRAALKAKDVKIAELQQRITALETERDLDKVIIKHFKSDMAQSINSRPSRGRGRGRGS
ncbi:MAG: hypothetical protein M1818_000738 [Claussenomyces sp. TS43310]|nr:MAG: hypothetical protein M1818_000738 [Claussenomyces sp. TS43310]